MLMEIVVDQNAAHWRLQVPRLRREVILTELKVHSCTVEGKLEGSISKDAIYHVC